MIVSPPITELPVGNELPPPCTTVIPPWAASVRSVPVMVKVSLPSPTNPSMNTGPRRLLAVCDRIGNVLTGGAVGGGGTKAGFATTLTVTGVNQSPGDVPAGPAKVTLGAVVALPAAKRESALETSVWPSVRRLIVTVAPAAGALARRRS